MNKNSSNQAQWVYLVDGIRTPFLKARGRANPFSAADLAVAAGRSLLIRQKFDASQLDEVILGCVMPSPEETNIARVAALRMGCGPGVPAQTVQRNCASGLQAVDTAVRTILSGQGDLILAGGVEAMSHAPLQLNASFVDWMAQWRIRRGWRSKMELMATLPRCLPRPFSVLLKGLQDPILGLSMGQTAEHLAHRFGIKREEMDAHAVESHRRAVLAQEAGWLKEESIVLADHAGIIYAADQGPRPDSSPEKLASLQPVFDRSWGKVTAGNSAQVSDGACWLLLASAEAVDRHDLHPIARVSPASWAGLAPENMGLGPVHAMAHLLARQELTVADVDAWEINEAFAAQILACRRAMADTAYCHKEMGLDTPMGEIPDNKLNIDGGAIAIGHPVGASGARIVWHLARILQRIQKRRGVASLCIGGGQGGAMLVENATCAA
ncbi:MAG: acetyl-CoA C-acetyltransferase [Magnetococcales bacterium]|nr:acetyl-CoA C-acetyltransferase [Magnetococcales bacterium]MBF0439612.1 acetyl-CoA C-acetyltransferase [Magnetococcales bacterium]